MKWLDYYKYEPMDGRTDCFIIEGQEGDLLIGDGLPRTEEEAKQYVRCANIAFNRAVELMVEAIQKTGEEVRRKAMKGMF
jgi:hypothetical protein